MPLYEYRCTRCGERTEVLQRLGAAPLGECPRCGGPVEKAISAPALQFKGSGWYVTDYGRKRSPSGAEGGGSDAANSTPTSEAKEAATKNVAASETAPKSS